MYCFLGIFSIKPYEYTFADEDADADDDPVLESGTLSTLRGV